MHHEKSNNPKNEREEPVHHHGHSENASAKADDATATTDPSITPAPMLPTAPLSVWFAAVELAPAVAEVALRDAEVVAVPVPAALVPVEVALVVDPVADVVVEFPAGTSPLSAALAGGGTALEASTRAPVPHGTGSLVPGWLALGAGTVWPLAEAMVKRVVQVLLGASGAVNW